MFEKVIKYVIFHELDQVHELFVWGQDPGARSTKILTHDSALRMRSCNTLTQELRIRSATPFVRIFVEWPPDQ